MVSISIAIKLNVPEFEKHFNSYAALLNCRPADSATDSVIALTDSCTAYTMYDIHV